MNGGTLGTCTIYSTTKIHLLTVTFLSLLLKKLIAVWWPESGIEL